MFASALLGCLLSVGGAPSSQAWIKDNNFWINLIHFNPCPLEGAAQEGGTVTIPGGVQEKPGRGTQCQGLVDVVGLGHGLDSVISEVFPPPKLILWFSKELQSPWRGLLLILIYQVGKTWSILLQNYLDT